MENFVGVHAYIRNPMYVFLYLNLEPAFLGEVFGVPVGRSVGLGEKPATWHVSQTTAPSDVPVRVETSGSRRSRTQLAGNAPRHSHIGKNNTRAHTQ